MHDILKLLNGLHRRGMCHGNLNLHKVVLSCTDAGTLQASALADFRFSTFLGGTSVKIPNSWPQGSDTGPDSERERAVKGHFVNSSWNMPPEMLLSAEVLPESLQTWDVPLAIDVWQMGFLFGGLALGLPLCRWPARLCDQQLPFDSSAYCALLHVFALLGKPKPDEWPYSNLTQFPDFRGALSSVESELPESSCRREQVSLRWAMLSHALLGRPDYMVRGFKPCSVRGRPNPTAAEMRQRLLYVLGADGIDLLKWLLRLNPAERPTLEQALSHRYFTGDTQVHRIEPTSTCSSPTSTCASPTDMFNVETGGTLIEDGARDVVFRKGDGRKLQCVDGRLDAYTQDVVQFQRDMQLSLRPVPGGFWRQPQVNVGMRAILVDWLVQVHYEWKFSPETLFLTVEALDRFLCCGTVILRSELQIVGVVCMFIVSKYMDCSSRTASDWVWITAKAYTEMELLAKEREILAALQFQIVVPTALGFLKHYAAVVDCEQTCFCLAQYLLELGLVDYDLGIADRKPSLRAAGALYLSRELLGEQLVWPFQVAELAKVSDEDLKSCVQSMKSLLDVAPNSNSFAEVYRKFSDQRFRAVATQFPLQPE